MSVTESVTLVSKLSARSEDLWHTWSWTSEDRRRQSELFSAPGGEPDLLELLVLFQLSLLHNSLI